MSCAMQLEVLAAGKVSHCLGCCKFQPNRSQVVEVHLKFSQFRKQIYLRRLSSRCIRSSLDSWADDGFLTRRQTLYLENQPDAVDGSPEVSSQVKSRADKLESWIEKRILDSRFLTLLSVIGSLFGSTICFTKGCLCVIESFKEFLRILMQGSHGGVVILLLVEAFDMYLIGTVMLIFVMGLYELFINTLDIPSRNEKGNLETSNFFGLFNMMDRPAWLKSTSLAKMKKKLGHIIVMILLVGLFEKSKKLPITTSVDFLLLSTSILFASCCLFLLSRLNNHGA